MRTYKAAYTKPITIKFDEETKEKLEQLAKEANVSQGEFVREAVQYYINFKKAEEYVKQLKQNNSLNEMFDKEFETATNLLFGE